MQQPTPTESMIAPTVGMVAPGAGPESRIAELERQLAAQKKISTVLINRIARSVEVEGGAVSLFEQNALLQQNVQQRTRELEESNRQLRLEIADRKMVEQALRFSEERYRFLLETTEQPFVVERDSDIVYANPAAARLLGYDDPADLLATGLASCIDPQFHELSDENYRLRLAGEEAPLRYEMRFLRRDGSGVYCEVSAQLGEFDGAPAVLASLHDISERKQAAAELANSLSLLQATLESTADGVLVVSNAGHIVTCNGKFAEMWDLPEGGCPEGNLDSVLARICGQLNDPAAFLDRIKQLHSDPDGLSFDFIECVDGRVFERFSQPQYVEGVSVGRVWSFRDVTARRRAENAIRESEERFRRLVEASPDHIIMLDRQGHIVFANRGTEELSVDDMLGNDGLGFINQEFHEKMREVLAQVQGEGCLVEIEFEGVSGRWYFARMAPVEANGETQFVMAVVADITERKLAEQQRTALEQQLRQAQKMEAIGTLAGGIAHDFNNILYAIQGYAELVLDSLEPDSAAAIDQREVLVAAQRAADLVKQILAFSRQSKSELQPVELSTVIREVLRLMRATLPTTISVDRAIAAPAATVLADSTQLHQVLMNLCTNAGQAMGESGGTMEVGLRTETVATDSAAAQLRAPGGYAVLSVRDTGPGIAPENLERIFDPFFTTKPVGHGTGLGLSTVHGIVTAAGGDIQVRSTVGLGTTFEVWLPLVESQASIVVEQAGAQRGTERILLVDDEPALARMLHDSLERQGYKVEAFTDSKQALAVFSYDPAAFDLVITDQTMPQLTGAELSARMLEQRPELPIVLCTGFSQTLDAERAADLGLRAYLTKPVGIRDLTATVRRVLDEHPVGTGA